MSARAAVSLHRGRRLSTHRNQLRDLFQDPLLIRRQGRYHLSGKAEALYAPLTYSTGASSMNLDRMQQDFRPENCTRRFNIAMSDMGGDFQRKTDPLFCAVPRRRSITNLGSREEMQGKFAGSSSLDLAFRGIYSHRIILSGTKTVLYGTLWSSVADKQYCTNGTMPPMVTGSAPAYPASMKPYSGD